MFLHHPFRRPRARRLAELTLAATVAISIIAVPGLLHGRGSRSAAAVSATSTTSAPASTSTSIRAAAIRHAVMTDPLHPRSVADEMAFRRRWESNASFRMRVAYANATPAKRAALNAYLGPRRPAPPAPPAPKPVHHVVRAAPVIVSTPVAAIPGWTVWDTIAQCESSGNWHDNTGNGYSGGLQFSPSTWTGYGGGQFAPMAWEASREQQIVVAERIHAAQGGYQAWPVCGRRA